MIQRFRIGVLLGFIVAASLIVFAEDARFPTSEDLRHVRSMDSPRLSPDGQQVLIRITDDTAHGGRAHLWLADVSGKPCRQLTYGPANGDKDSKYRGESSGEWMPDGESILFLSHRGEQTQLFRLSMHGGEAVAFDLKVVPTVDDSKAPDRSRWKEHRHLGQGSANPRRETSRGRKSRCRVGRSRSTRNQTLSARYRNF